MTEYEIKARELVDKFAESMHEPPNCAYCYGGCGGGCKIIIESAKKCALLCVEEIIKEWDKFEIQDSGKIYNGNGQDYWRLVKQEINKL